jgi:hypothetical protein
VCPQRAVHAHHVVYRQHCRGHEADLRNMVPLCFRCHEKHHTRTGVLRTRVLPDEALEFAVEVLGAGPAQAYMERYYDCAGDPRVPALYTEVKA